MARIRPYLETAAVYCATFLVILVYSKYREGEWNFVAAGLFAVVAAVWFFFQQRRLRAEAEDSLRSWRTEVDKAVTDATEHAQKRAGLNELCADAAEAISYLSLVDLSVFISMAKRIKDGEDDTLGCVTTSDSMLHIAFEKLERVGCAAPHDFIPIHDAALLPGTITFQLTDIGRQLLEPLLLEAKRKREIRAAIAAEMGQ